MRDDRGRESARTAALLQALGGQGAAKGSQRLLDAPLRAGRSAAAGAAQRGVTGPVGSRATAVSGRGGEGVSPHQKGQAPGAPRPAIKRRLVSIARLEQRNCARRVSACADEKRLLCANKRSGAPRLGVCMSFRAWKLSREAGGDWKPLACACGLTVLFCFPGESIPIVSVEPSTFVVGESNAASARKRSIKFECPHGTLPRPRLTDKLVT